MNIHELQEWITTNSIQHYRKSLKEYLKTLNETDSVTYILYVLHTHKRCSPSVLFGSIAHNYISEEELLRDINYCIDKQLITWEPDKEIFITVFQDDYKGYGYVLPDVIPQTVYRDDVQEILYSNPLQLNPYVINNFIETKNTYSKYNYICKKAYEKLGANTFHINYKYDYRGRMYAKGYYINPQGTSYNKACIQSAIDIPITGEL